MAQAAVTKAGLKKKKEKNKIFSHGSYPEVGQKQKTEKNTPGTRDGPGCHDRTLAVKRRKKPEISLFS